MPAPVKLSEHFVGLLIGVLLFCRAAGEPPPKQNSWQVFATAILSFFGDGGARAAELADGEALILQPASLGDPTLLA
jgi:hypothetical protein